MSAPRRPRPRKRTSMRPPTGRRRTDPRTKRCERERRKSSSTRGSRRSRSIFSGTKAVSPNDSVRTVPAGAGEQRGSKVTLEDPIDVPPNVVAAELPPRERAGAPVRTSRRRRSRQQDAQRSGPDAVPGVTAVVAAGVGPRTGSRGVARLRTRDDRGTWSGRRRRGADVRRAGGVAHRR